MNAALRFRFYNVSKSTKAQPSAFTPQQCEAIEGRGNLLVVAGAGTGKTRTLVARALRLVEEGASFENILMVTFTEAAAAEMRGRMRRELLAFQENNPGNDHLAQQIALLDTARICTLHSFCLQLVREHFHELGLDPQFGVLDEQQTRPLMRLTLEELLERHYAGSDAASQAVRAMIRTVGRGLDVRIQRLVIKLHHYSQSLPDPAGWLDEQQQRFEKTNPDDWRQWLVDAVSALRDDWEPALAAADAAVPAVKISLEALRGLTAKPSLADAAGMLSAIRAADGDAANWPRGTKGRVRDPLKPFFEDAEFLALLLPDDKGRDPLAEDWDWSRHHMSTLVSLVREFTAGFTRAKRDLGGLDFADLEQCALRLLVGPDGPTATAHEWQQRLEHIFVDEYQDINAAQDAILTALARNGKEANRFLVGDVKQSIYRFRRANPHIFSGYDARWKKAGADGNRIPLTENFRSREALLDFVNPVFESLMRREVGGVAYEPLQFGAPEDRAVLSVRPGDAPVTEFHLIARADSGGGVEDQEGEEDERQVPDLLSVEREARLVARRLRELKDGGHQIWDAVAKSFRPVEWRDMAVLMRSPAGRAEAFAMEFSRAGVPLVAARDGFFRSLEVADLVNLLRLLDNPLQDVPLAAVLHSPLVGLSSDELAEIRASSPKLPFWTALKIWDEKTQLVAPKQGEGGNTQQTVSGFLHRFDLWRVNVRQSSLSQTLETVLAETQYEALLQAGERGVERVANVCRLLDLARQFDPHQRQGLYRFLRFVQAQEDEEMDLQPAPAVADNAVQLLSIHKAKGLEFPVVVVAGLGTQFNEQDFNEPVLLSENFGLCPKVTPPGAELNYPSLPYWLARRAERRELRGEELRLLYVALTRARDHLILMGATARKTDGAKWEAATEPAIGTRDVTAARSHLDWLLMWLPHGTADADWQDDRSGQNQLLRWRIYDESDPAFAHMASAEDDNTSFVPAEPPDADAVEKLKARLAWNYPLAAATAEIAKTSVTAVRRRLEDEQDDEVQRLFPAPLYRPSRKARGKRLSAAERGIAHHLFLEQVGLDQTGSEEALKTAAKRLQEAGKLTAEQVGELEFKALAAFWSSKIGRRIRGEAGSVRRELSFTARFSPGELASAVGWQAQPEMQDEFVVVQGTADLAVVLSEEIWLVDFKTDEMGQGGLGEKTRLYQPQIKLYALAMERVYGRPVTERWLHFLSTGETVRVGY